MQALDIWLRVSLHCHQVKDPSVPWQASSHSVQENLWFWRECWELDRQQLKEKKLKKRNTKSTTNTHFSQNALLDLFLLYFLSFFVSDIISASFTFCLHVVVFFPNFSLNEFYLQILLQTTLQLGWGVFLSLLCCHGLIIEYSENIHLTLINHFCPVFSLSCQLLFKSSVIHIFSSVSTYFRPHPLSVPLSFLPPCSPPAPPAFPFRSSCLSQPPAR